MTVLVTGAAGFIGSALVNELADRGERVIALVRKRVHQDGSRDPNVRYAVGDLRSLEFSELLAGVATVYHLAWSSLPASSNLDPITDAAENIIGTLRLLEAVKSREQIRFVFASSGGTIYGRLASDRASETHPTRPISAYGVSKLTVENYLGFYNALWGLNSVALRISNAYGAGQSIDRNFGAVSTFVARARDNEPIAIYGDGSIVRDYLHASDIVAALIRAGERRNSPPVINIGSGIGHSLNQIVATIETVLGRRVARCHQPGRPVDVPVSVLENSLAEATLGWRPLVDLEAGLRLMLTA